MKEKGFKGQILLFSAVLIAISLYPVFSVTIPPLIDYPNHLARMHVIFTHDGSEAFQRMFDIRWSISPYYAMEAVMLPLMNVMSVYSAGKVLIALVFILLVIGTAVIHRAVHGRMTMMPLFVCTFLYNYILVWGFMDFLMGAGLSLCMFGGWILTEKWQWKSRTLLFSSLAIVLFFCHLYAIAIYGFLVFSYELGRFVRGARGDAGNIFRKILPVAGQFVLPVILFLFSEVQSLSYQHDGLSVTFSTWVYSDLPSQIRSPFAAFFYRSLDVMSELDPVFMSRCLLTVGIVILLSFGFFSFNKALLFPAAALFLLSVILPSALFGIAVVNCRLSVLIVACVIAGLSASSKHEWQMAAPYKLFLVAAVFLIFQVFFVKLEMTQYDLRFKEFRTASAVIPKGASILTIEEMPEKLTCQNLPTLAVIERDAYVPELFSHIPPIRLRSEYSNVAHIMQSATIPATIFFGQPLELAYVWWGARNWRRDYDYILWLHHGLKRYRIPDGIEKVHAGSFFDIYKVQK